MRCSPLHFIEENNMKERTKQNLIVAVISVTLFAALMNLSAVLSFCKSIIDIISPIIAGGILALFISVPMNGIEKKLRKLNDSSKRKKLLSENTVHILSFALTVICILLVLVLALTLLVPELTGSCRSLIAQIENNIPRWREYLDEKNYEYIESLLAGINTEQIMSSVSNGVNSVLSGITGALSSLMNVIITAAFALIFSIYIALEKNEVCRHANKLAYAYMKPSWYEFTVQFCRLFRSSFASFLTGQCSEAVILGTLMALSMTLLGVPYALIIGVLTAICAIIPYIGAFLSCSISVLLVLMTDPMLAVRCLIIYLAVQFIENQFIYPRVVGSSVGLPPLYILISAMIGGELFGIIGIIFFIPLAAVIIELVKQDARRRINDRSLPEQTDAPAEADQ